MSNSKISALTSASTPLAGTETLPVVQSSTTKQVSVANLTAGRAVSGLSFAAATIGAPASTTLSLQANATTYITVLGAGTNNGYVGIGTVSPANTLSVNALRTTSSGEFLGGITAADTTTGGAAGVGGVISFSGDTQGAGLKQFAAVLGGKENSTLTDYAGYLSLYTRPGGGSLTEVVKISSQGNVTLNTGNLVQGTAAKGVNFTANTPLAGMTSQLLNWYEEGTFTTTWTNLTGTPTSTTLYYTRIGRLVFFTYPAGAAVITGTANSTRFSLPFTPSKPAVGAMITDAVGSAGNTLIWTGTVVYPATFSASGLIFSGTYYV
jgi:hypothetical protein